MLSNLFGRIMGNKTACGTHSPSRTRSRQASFRPSFEQLEDRTLLSAVSLFTPSGAGGGGSLFSPSISPNDSNNIYLASDMGQMFHSTNGGQSWSEVNFNQLQPTTDSQVQFSTGSAILYGIDTRNDSPTPT